MTKINVEFTRDSPVILIPSEKTYKVEIGNIHLELFSYVEHESERDYSETWYWLENRVFDLYTDQIFDKSFYTVGEALDDALETMIRICNEPDNKHMAYCLEDIENFKKSSEYKDLQPTQWEKDDTGWILPLQKPIPSLYISPDATGMILEIHMNFESITIEERKDETIALLRSTAYFILEQTVHLI